MVKSMATCRNWLSRFYRSIPNNIFTYCRIMRKTYKSTPKEKMIVNLMEEVISILSTCEDLSDPEFSMYEVMKDAVDKEVYYPLYDK